jgi:hypothetical protein
MESFIDGDLAANNGGWQWTASTGTDPQPYFVCPPFPHSQHQISHFLFPTSHPLIISRYNSLSPLSLLLFTASLALALHRLSRFARE